jgi:hypothetical protein
MRVEQEIIERAVDRLDKEQCLSTRLDFTKAGVIINTAIQDATRELRAACANALFNLHDTVEVRRILREALGEKGATAREVFNK